MKDKYIIEHRGEHYKLCQLDLTKALPDMAQPSAIACNHCDLNDLCDEIRMGDEYPFCTDLDVKKGPHGTGGLVQVGYFKRLDPVHVELMKVKELSDAETEQRSYGEAVQ